MVKIKKIASLICTVCIMGSLCALPVKADGAIDSEKLNNAANLLKVLDITDATFDKESYSENISRGDFVLCVAKMIETDGIEYKNDITYYNDVPMDFWALKEINRLVECGALTVPESREFRPHDSIKKTEAMKILLSLMKYDTYCAQMGGFPSGYTSVAYEYDMGDNLSSGEYMTYADTLMLIYNALEVPMMGIDYNGTVLYEDETLLSYYYDSYSVEGQVTSVGGMAISGDVAYDGEICIDNEKYSLESGQGLEFLGQNVKAYIREDSRDELTVISVEAISRKNEVLEIDIDDIKDIDMSTYSVEYYKDGSKTDTVKLNKGIVVLKNGENVSDSLSSAFSFDKGIIRLVDVDNDERFDYAFNSVYRNIVVGYIDENTQTVYDKITEQNSISLDNYRDKSINIYKNGAKSSFSAITENSLLSVFDSSEYLRIDIGTETVTGQVFEINTEEETELLIGVTESEASSYVVTDEFLKYVDAKLKVGVSGTFYCDAYGKIAYGVIGEETEYVYAYIKKVVENEDTGCVALRVLEQNGTQHTVNCSEKVRIDGAALKGVSEQKALLESFAGEVVRIKKRDADVVEIDTALPILQSKTAQEFSKTASETEQRYVWGQKRFGKLILHSDNTVFFVVPSDINNTSEEMYTVTTKDFFIGSRYYDVDSYKLSYTEPFENVIVAKLKSTPQMASQTMFLVSDKKTVLDENDEIVTRIEGYYAGAKTSFIAAETLDCSQFDEGDIIMITAKDINGKVTSCKLRYDNDAENAKFDYTSDGVNSVSTNEYNNYHYMVGNVIDTSDGVISLGYNDAETVDLKMLASSTGTIICYRADEKGDNKFYKGSSKDLVPSHYTNPNYTRIVAWVKAGVIQWAVAYQPVDE